MATPSRRAQRLPPASVRRLETDVGCGPTRAYTARITPLCGPVLPAPPSAMHPYTASPGASGLSSIYMHGTLHSKPLARNPNTRNKGCSVDGCCTLRKIFVLFALEGLLVRRLRRCAQMNYAFPRGTVGTSQLVRVRRATTGCRFQRIFTPFRCSIQC